MSNETTLKIRRLRTFMGSLLSCRVILDGKEISKIANGETAFFSVSPGHHSIFLKGFSGEKTQKIDFDISLGETKVFECGVPFIYSSVLILWLLYLILSRFFLDNSIMFHYLDIGLLSFLVLFFIACIFKPGLCYYLKEVEEPQNS